LSGVCFHFAFVQVTAEVISIKGIAEDTTMKGEGTEKEEIMLMKLKTHLMQAQVN